MPGGIPSDPEKSVSNHSSLIPLTADHSSIAKFSGREDKGYQKVVQVLREICNEAPRIADENWKRYSEGGKTYH
jgi:hypothetical protein